MDRSVFSKELNAVKQYLGARAERYLGVLGYADGPFRFLLHIPALIGGEFYAAWHKLFVAFWIILALNLTGATLVAQGFNRDLGGEHAAQAEQYRTMISERKARISKLEAEGQDTASLRNSTASLQRAADEAVNKAEDASKGATMLVAIGLSLLLAVRIVWAFLAPNAIRRRFERWRSAPSIGRPGGVSSVYYAALLPIFLYAAVMARFALNDVPLWLSEPPTFQVVRFNSASVIDGLFSWMTINFHAVFEAITISITKVLGDIENLLIGIPWFVTTIVVVSLAYRVANLRTAFFCAASIAYIVAFDFWVSAMYTLSLLGVAAGLSILIGIPLGIACARSERLYKLVRPMLDLMQTMPSFVYLIPVIAFFGTGKPPGVIATIIFGMPPVVRLTVLGIRNVPHAVVEAAEAYGANKWFILSRVQLPLAKASIMAGVNQTILMSLSMVVIASLIGAKGLGENVLEALQYSAKGQGILAGVAILLCAMMLDRIVQGKEGSTPT